MINFLKISFKNKIYSISVLFLTSLFFMAAFFFIKEYNSNKNILNHFTVNMESQTSPRYLYQNIDNELFFQLYSDKSGIERLLDFNNYLNNTFNYLEKHTSSARVDKDKFVYNETFLDPNINEDGLKLEQYFLKTISINEATIKYNNFKIQKGSHFSDEDFMVPEDNLPIILGNSYVPYYELNDTIQLDYLDKTFTAKIIGFLEPDMVLENGYPDPTLLDDYIIIPSFKLEQISENNDDSQLFEFKFLMDKNNGYIISEMDKEEINNLLSNYSDGELGSAYRVSDTSVELTKIYGKKLNNIIIVGTITTGVLFFLNSFILKKFSQKLQKTNVNDRFLYFIALELFIFLANKIAFSYIASMSFYWEIILLILLLLSCMIGSSVNDHKLFHLKKSLNNQNE